MAGLIGLAGFWASPRPWVVSAGVLFAVLVYLRRRGRPPVLGPLFGHELTRAARLGREPWLRGAYAGLLLALLCWLHADWLAAHGHGAWAGFGTAAVPVRDMARFAG